jgi:broad specificity phosphatase PhoE
VRAQGAGETVVYLVRHAEQANKTEKDPVLSDAGKARSEALAAAMKDAKLDAVFVTQLKRSSETAVPVAAAKKITPSVISVGASPTDHAAAVAKAVLEHKGKAVLVIGHSNTVTAIIAALGGPKLPNICDASYSILFTLRIPAAGTPALSRATYGRPDSSEPTSCGALLSK